MTAKSSVDSVRMEMIADMAIPIPPIMEQRAISEALSDVDALIASLDALIAKKRAIKQGMMQELLTGKRRLPGYGDKWEEKSIGELLAYEQPTKYIVKNTDYNPSNGIPVLTANKSFILGYTNEEFGIYNNLPVIIFDDFITDSKFVDFPFKVKSSAIKLLRPKSDLFDIRFIFEKMQLIEFVIGEHKRHYISEYQYIKISTSLILYDDVPGGAGHVKRIMNYLPETILAARERVSLDCCGIETSCTECLRNYRNQPYHEELKRGLAKSFLDELVQSFNL